VTETLRHLGEILTYEELHVLALDTLGPVKDNRADQALVLAVLAVAEAIRLGGEQ
jgi:hypothetical protein